MRRGAFVVFTVAFFLNFAWEEWHSRFYVHYQGVPITHSVLFRAAFFDAFVTLMAWLLYSYMPPFRGRKWFTLACLVLFAVGLELFALGTSRWAYAASMVRLPLLGVGLTPTIQLALVAALSFIAAGY